jgi:hypothetical protein
MPLDRSRQVSHHLKLPTYHNRPGKKHKNEPRKHLLYIVEKVGYLRFCGHLVNTNADTPAHILDRRMAETAWVKTMLLEYLGWDPNELTTIYGERKERIGKEMTWLEGVGQVC